MLLQPRDSYYWFPFQTIVSIRFAYTATRVQDMGESIRFYTELLGMEIVSPLEPTRATQGQVVTLRSPGSTQLLELNWYELGTRLRSVYSSGEEPDHLAFECDTVEDTAAELERRGVKVLTRPREIGADVGWNEAFVKDPSGIWIELVPRKNKG